MRIAYIHRNDGTDMRVSKECNSLVSAGHEVHFIGWKPDPTVVLPDPMPEIPKYFNSRALARKSSAAPIGYARHVWSRLSELKPDVAHCVNEEHAAIALIHRKVTGKPRYVVCDIFDSLGLRLTDARAPIPRLASSVASWVQNNSDRLIVTDDRRLKLLGELQFKAVVVPNYPVDPGSHVTGVRAPKSGPVRLLVAGTLKASRGLSSITELLELDEHVQVICAGWPYDETAEEFVRHPRVDFKGVMTPSDALLLAATCDAIVALYAPTNKNNLLASPNKIFDALCIGRPVIINVETAVSSWVAEVNAGFVVRYGEIEDLLEVVRAIRDGRGDSLRMASRLRTMFLQGFSWSEAEACLLPLYEAL